MPEYSLSPNALTFLQRKQTNKNELVAYLNEILLNSMISTFLINRSLFFKGHDLLKIYKAKKIITMNPRNPESQYMSVLDGKIVQVGDLNTIKPDGK